MFTQEGIYRHACLRARAWMQHAKEPVTLPQATPKKKAGASGASVSSVSGMAGTAADETRLRAYIAKVTTNIGNVGSDFGIGITPPSRSFRGLLCFHEFDRVKDEISKCLLKQELAAVNQRWKTFKTSLTDLQNMVKAAETRVAATVAEARKKAKIGTGVGPRGCHRFLCILRSSGVCAVSGNVSYCLSGVSYCFLRAIGRTALDSVRQCTPRFMAKGH